MKGQLILAEYATAHRDGTITIVRGGIGRVVGPSMPVPFQGSLVVRIEGEIGDQGNHVIDLRCLNEDGRSVLPTMQGGIEIPSTGGGVNLVFGVAVAFSEKGRLIWVLRADHRILDQLHIQVEVGTADPQVEA